MATEAQSLMRDSRRTNSQMISLIANEREQNTTGLIEKIAFYQLV